MTTHLRDIEGYRYENGALNTSHRYLLPALRRCLNGLDATGSRRLFDLGCGNGAIGASLAGAGWTVTGVDPSADGVAAARVYHPGLSVHTGSGYDNLAARFGRFPVVISLEVIEHVYAPRSFARTLADLLEPGGTAILSTPYHGYWKNLALSLSGRMDRHFTALWDHGHIKFWSRATLGTLLEEAGLKVVRFDRIGRVPPFAKSMIAMAEKPGC